MELEHLNEFLVLAERKSYAQSAEELFISQSALSKHIAAMETKLGVRLFHRDSRSVQLTKYGELLVPYARNATAEWSAFRGALDEALRADQGGLRVGAAEGLRELGLTRRIAGFIAENHGLSIELMPVDDRSRRDALLTGRLDLAFALESAPTAADEFARAGAAVDRIVAVLPERHPLACRGSVSLAELAEEPLLPIQPERFLSRFVRNIFRRAGVVPRFLPPQSSGIGAPELAAGGVGAALELESIAAETRCPGAVVVPLSVPERVWLNLLWLPDRLPPTGKAFVACIRGAK